MFYSLKNPPLFISPIGQKKNNKLFQLRKQIASDKKKKKEKFATCFSVICLNISKYLLIMWNMSGSALDGGLLWLHLHGISN